MSSRGNLCCYSRTRSTLINISQGFRSPVIAGVLVPALLALSACRESVVQSTEPPDPGPAPAFWETMMLPSSAPIQTILAEDTSDVFGGTWDGGLYRTTDGGEVWEEITGGVADDILSIGKCADGSLVIGTDAAIYRSTDDGRSWDLVLAANAVVRDISVGETGEVVAVAFGRGLYHSTDDGITWAELPDPPSDTFLCVALSPGGVIHVGTNKGLYRTIDLGASWDQPFSTSAANAPSDITRGVDGTLITGIGPTLYISTDDGVTWIGGTPLSVSSVSTTLVLPARVFVAGTIGDGVFISVDTASTWGAINSGLDGLEIRSIAVDPHGYLYAGTWFDGLFRSRAVAGIR